MYIKKQNNVKFKKLFIIYCVIQGLSVFMTALFETIFATFRGSFTKVLGHCISVQPTGTMGGPFGPHSLEVAMTTPNSFSAVLS